jgi:hypothetical protein
MSTTIIQIIDGDLLSATADVIVQQCNCVTKYPLGLAEAISKKLGVDPYNHRQLLRGKKNFVIQEHQGKPGTTILYDRQIEGDIRYVACMMAQFSPSKPGLYHRDQMVGRIDPISKEPLKDDYNQRLTWFRTCLEDLHSQLERIMSLPEYNGNKLRVAFPYLIGCGLAGGDWNDYYQMIETWAIKHEDKFIVTIVRKKISRSTDLSG